MLVLVGLLLCAVVTGHPLDGKPHHVAKYAHPQHKMDLEESDEELKFGVEIEVSGFRLMNPNLQKGDIWWTSKKYKNAQICAELQGVQGRMGLEGKITPPLPMTTESRAEVEGSAIALAAKYTELVKLARAMVVGKSSGLMELFGFKKRDPTTVYTLLRWCAGNYDSPVLSYKDKMAKWAMLELQNARICSCDAYGSQLPEVRTNIVPPWGRTYSGCGYPGDTSDWKHAWIFTSDKYPDRDLLVGNMQVTADIKLGMAGLYLWLHDDFNPMYNSVPQLPVPFPAKIAETLLFAHVDCLDVEWGSTGAKDCGTVVLPDTKTTLTLPFAWYPGGDAYLGWSAYYLYAMVEGMKARSKQSCTLLNPKDSVLLFVVRTRFSKIHEYVNANRPKNPNDGTKMPELPTGDDFWDIIYAIAKEAWWTETNQGWPLSSVKDCTIDNYQIQNAFTSNKYLLKDFVKGQSTGDLSWFAADPSLDTIKSTVTKQLVIEFRKPNTVCQLPHATRKVSKDSEEPKIVSADGYQTMRLWSRDVMGHFDFFKAFNVWKPDDNESEMPRLIPHLCDQNNEPPHNCEFSESDAGVEDKTCRCDDRAPIIRTRDRSDAFQVLARPRMSLHKANHDSSEVESENWIPFEKVDIDGKLSVVKDERIGKSSNSDPEGHGTPRKLFTKGRARDELDVLMGYRGSPSHVEPLTGRRKVIVKEPVSSSRRLKPLSRSRHKSVDLGTLSKVISKEVKTDPTDDSSPPLLKQDTVVIVSTKDSSDESDEKFTKLQTMTVSHLPVSVGRTRHGHTSSSGIFQAPDFNAPTRSRHAKHTVMKDSEPSSEH